MTIKIKIIGKRQVGGSLSEYAKNLKRDIPFRKMKDKAWEESVYKKKKLGLSKPSS